MHLQLIFFFAVFLFPVATYLSILAWVNRRDHPVIISGVWDSVGLLLACSGFFLAAGPAILSALYENRVLNLLSQKDPGIWLDVWNQWGLLWFGYYFCIITGALALLWLRRNTTVIYNVHPPAFDRVLEQTVERLGYSWRRQGHRVYLQRSAVVAVSATLEGEHSPAPDARAASENNLDGRTIRANPFADLVLKIDPFPLLYNISLHWSGVRELREELQVELKKGLDATHTHNNPTAGWFIGLASLFYLLMLITITFMFVVMMLTSRLS